MGQRGLRYVERLGSSRERRMFDYRCEVAQVAQVDGHAFMIAVNEADEKDSLDR